jgi:hypothetical protein
MQKIPHRFEGIVLAFFTSMFMSMLMSCVVSLLNLGPVDGFLLIWARAFFTSWIIAFPSVLLVLPVVQRLLTKIVAPS